MQAYMRDDRVLIEARYEDREIIKALGDYKWNKDLGAWEFPLWKLPYLSNYLNLQYCDDVKVALEKEIAKEKDRRQLLDYADTVKTQPKLADTFENLKKLDVSKLFIHQKQALAVSSLFDSYALFMEMGLGKSLVAIRLIQLRKVPTLIVCPLSTIESVWMNELDKWAPELTKMNLWDFMKKWNYFDLRPCDVKLINFESFKKIENPEKYFDFIIIDESSKMKSHSTQITKKLLSVRNKIKYRLIMSGLPAPNDLLEYWAQMEFVNENLLR